MNTSSNGYWITDLGWDGDGYDVDDAHAPTSHEPMQREFVYGPRYTLGDMRKETIAENDRGDPAIALGVACGFLDMTEGWVSSMWPVFSRGDNRFIRYSTMMQIARRPRGT